MSKSQFKAQPVEKSVSIVETKVACVDAREICLSDGQRGVRVRQETNGEIYIGINRVGKNAHDAFITPEEFFRAIGKLVKWANETTTAGKKAAKAKGGKRKAA